MSDHTLPSQPPAAGPSFVPELQVDTESSSSGSEGYGSAPDSPPPSKPPYSRSQSTSSTYTTGSSQESDEWEIFPPLDKLTIFDYLDQLALPQRLEKINKTYIARKDRVKDQVKRRYEETKAKAFQKTDLEFEKYKKKYEQGFDRILSEWESTRIISTRQKVSFVVGVSNIFVMGYLIGAYPEWVHVAYSIQLMYFMPIRYYTYHKRGYHYFMADMCYFVNVLLLLALWVFPNSRRLMISAYCLSYGNNAWAIAMWRNSLVFHSLDKVTSLFIHLMPPVVLHCLIHLVDPVYVEERFPSISRIQNIEKYGLWDMILWATVPYAIWQLSYHFLITVRRRDKIAAGRPTSFTWLKKSYAKTWIGKMVLQLPEPLQEAAFMSIQYSYAVLTMLPCPVWFYHRAFSALFLSAVGLWSVYNGATFYIDVFGKKFEKELEQLKKEAAKWQNTPQATQIDQSKLEKTKSVDALPQLDSQGTDQQARSSGAEAISHSQEVKERNATTGSLPVSS